MSKDGSILSISVSSGSNLVDTSDGRMALSLGDSKMVDSSGSSEVDSEK